MEVSEPGLLLVYTTGSSHIKGTLEDSTGDSLATDDDGGRSDNFRITHFVNAGTYYVQGRRRLLLEHGKLYHSREYSRHYEGFKRPLLL